MNSKYRKQDCLQLVLTINLVTTKLKNQPKIDIDLNERERLDRS